MPLQHVLHLGPHTIIGVWRLTEPESFFTPHINKIATDLNNLNSITHPNRRCEWLAGRWLVHELVERMHISFNGIWTDEHNKPHLKEENASISISHATPYVVAILNTKEPCGIDVERIKPKLQSLAKKFLNEDELAMSGDDLTTLAICWGAKEALYKLHGRKSLIFKENLAIKNFQSSGNLAQFIGEINLAGEKEGYHLKAGCFDDFVLVYTDTSFSN